VSSLPPHPWVTPDSVWVPYSDAPEGQARMRIREAVEVLGYDVVNTRAYEWTRSARVDDLQQMLLFADAIGGEAYAYREQQRRRIEQERQAARELLRRRNAAASLLLDTD
jgi:hypothetical protein